jgi:hypothetical protein
VLYNCIESTSSELLTTHRSACLPRFIKRDQHVKFRAAVKGPADPDPDRNRHRDRPAVPCSASEGPKLKESM